MPTVIIGDGVLDNGLQYIEDHCDEVHICSALPTTYAEAQTTYDLGVKTSPSFTGPANGDASGRKMTVDAIADGAVSATDTATHWALVYTGNSELLAAGPLDSSQAVTSGNGFTLTAFDVELPDAE